MKRLGYLTIALITFGLGVAIHAFSQIGSRHTSVDTAIILPLPLEQPFHLEAESDAVYSAVIRDMYVESSVNLLVIEEADGCPTKDDVADGKIAHLRADMEEWAFNAMPSLEPETIDDLHTDSKACFLNRRLNVAVDYIVVDSKEIERFFKDGLEGWTGFYRRYPNSSGIISFSRIGFNRERNQALVSSSRGCGGLCGSGHYVLLSKSHGSWRVDNMVMTWVS